MDSSTNEQGPRSFMLELPPEIRLMIYEELTKLHPPDSNFIYLERCKGTGYNNLQNAALTAITRVNHQIRREAIPILYRGLEIVVQISTEKDQRAVHQWLANASPALLQAVRTYSFYTTRYCVCPCLTEVCLLDSGYSVELPGDNEEDDCEYDYHILETYRTYKTHAENIVEDLEVFEGKGPIFTKVVM